MSRSIATLLGIGLATISVGAPATAQRHKTVVVSAGVAGPTDEFASEVDPGWQLSAALDIPIGAEIGSLRVELDYVRFGSLVTAQNPRMIPLLVSVVAEFPGTTVRPFLIGGTGIYHFRVSDPEFTDSKFGLNVGAGTVWRGVSLAGRYHSVFDRGDSYWTLTLGLRL